MNTLYIILALLSLPAVFFTLYEKTERGQKIRLGSYFIIKNFTSRVFRVRSLRDRLLLAVRLAFALILALLILDPLEMEIPERESLLHSGGEKTGAETEAAGKGALLDIPSGPLDSFNEDIFFISALAGSLPPHNNRLTIMYSPDSERIAKAEGDLIIFPGPVQDRKAFDRWSGVFYISDLLETETGIRGAQYTGKKYYRPVILDREMVSVYSRLENDTPLAFSIQDGGRRLLIFTAGMAEAWGDAGISGHFMDIIIRFQKNIAISDGTINAAAGLHGKTGRASGRLPHKTLLYIALLFFIAELALFIYRSLSLKKKGAAAAILFLIFFSTTSLNAGGFVFIELDTHANPDMSNNLMFSRIKTETEKRTSIKISPVYYKKITTAQFASGIMPELPYLWIIGCKGPGFFSKGVKQAMSKFMDRGGIIFIETCGKPDDSAYLSEINSFIVEQAGYDPDKGLLPRLPSDHPIYKSFFLLPGGSFFGIDVSLSTRRTALIFSRGSFKNGVLSNNDTALRTGINILMYMLSGNYKSDQIHTRQILKKLKDRELYR